MTKGPALFAKLSRLVAMRNQTTHAVYKKILTEGLRYITDDLLQLRRMTSAEYDMRMDAAILRQHDQLRLVAMAALYNRKAKQTKEVGKNKFVYKHNEITDFVDIEKIEKEIYGDPQREDVFDRLHQVASNVREFKERGIND